MALNILQGESSVHMGSFLSTLQQLQDELKSSCKVCVRLIDDLQDGTQKHFVEMTKESELIAGALLQPKFKMNRNHILKAGKC